ncbi:MAG: 50S ribosomal protein L35 [Candidatus Abyssubacteria bacterium]|nr:50S ribosomal protein L35 [Candidatus Abyssubacteria bacterium]
MPKKKTHKGLKGRVKISANGKVLHKRAGTSHLMSGMSGKRRRRLRKRGSITGRTARSVILGVGGKA